MSEGFATLLEGCTNFVFLGEAGCGKSEAAMNVAALLAGKGPTELYDLDQTKPLYRSRDAAAAMAGQGVRLIWSRQYEDCPTEAGGVENSLADPGRYTVLDLGGNAFGARMAGRYARLMASPETRIFFVINCYRPWSGTRERAEDTLYSVLSASRAQSPLFLANPHLGTATRPEDFLLGLEKTRELLAPENALAGACAWAPVAAGAGPAGLPVLPMKLYLRYEWNREKRERSM